MDFIRGIRKYFEIYENENIRYQNLWAATAELLKREIHKCLYLKKGKVFMTSTSTLKKLGINSKLKPFIEDRK